MGVVLMDWYIAVSFIERPLLPLKQNIMKFFNCLLGTAVLLTISTLSYAQKYKSSADTGKLNAEYVKVQNKIADLTTQLATAEGNLPGYQTKATNAGNTAQTATATSDASSSKATSGNLQDAKDAKKSANDSYNSAKDAQTANNNVGKQNEKIRKLSDELKKQRQRLKDLDIMRASIHEQSLNNSQH